MHGINSISNSLFLHDIEAITSWHEDSQPLCRENTYKWRNAIYQTEFDGSCGMCETHYSRWQLSGWYRGVVLKISSVANIGVTTLSATRGRP